MIYLPICQNPRWLLSNINESKNYKWVNIHVSSRLAIIQRFIEITLLQVGQESPLGDGLQMTIPVEFVDWLSKTVVQTVNYPETIVQ